MFLDRRVAAFSLVEMLVVLVLSAMITGYIYFVYYTVNSYQMNLSRKYSQVEDVNSLYTILAQDFDQSTSIVALNNESLLVELQGKPMVRYTFFSKIIRREQAARVDSVPIASAAIMIKFQGKPVVTGLVDELDLASQFASRPIRLVILKQYDAATLIQYDPDRKL